MDEVRLYFTTGRVLRLFRIECIAGSARHVAVVSGSRAGGDGVGVFRWSRGVKVVSILFVRLALATVDSSIEPRIEGGRGSLAASLDGVLSQEPMWLVEMFGVVNKTNPRCRRFFVRSNPGRKRCGPVAVSISHRVRSEHVRIFLNNTPASDKLSLERILKHLLDQVF